MYANFLTKEKCTGKTHIHGYILKQKNIIYKTNAAFQIHVYGVTMHESFHYNNNWIKKTVNQRLGDQWHNCYFKKILFGKYIYRIYKNN